jgi:hypothetical protein
MLVIRNEQMEVFRQAALVAFENEMVAHSQDFSPKLSKVIGEEQLRLAVCNAITRAGGYGFTNRGPIRLYIELMFLFGSAFDSDPQYPWATSILQDLTPQMQRAERLYEKVLDYQEKVSGPEGINTREALRHLGFLAQQPLIFTANDFIPNMLREMANIFPQKTAYIGEAALEALIRESGAVAQRARFPNSRGYFLMVALMFAFGHGCADDPLYPWIARALTDEKIASPAARAERLEKKTLTWLDHVLANIP